MHKNTQKYIKILYIIIYIISDNMYKYECKACKYETQRKLDLERHKTSKKHMLNVKKYELNEKKSIKNAKIKKRDNVTSEHNSEHNSEQKSENEKYACEYCNIIFTTKTSMYRHIRKYCKKKNDINLINENKELKEKNEKIEKQMEELLKLANKNADVVTKNAETINIATKNNKKTINMMSYAVDNLQDAPVIKQLRCDKIMSMLSANNKSKKFSVEEVLLHQFENNILHQYIGDLILMHYKMDDPDDQSVWTTDVARSNFIIKCAVKGNDESEWINDKSGTKLKKFVIIPILNKIKDIMNDFSTKISNKMKDVNISIEDARFCVVMMMNCGRLISVILKKKICIKVLHYISPSFDFKVNENLFLGDDSDSDSESDYNSDSNSDQIDFLS